MKQRSSTPADKFMGARLRAARIEAKITQAELGEQLGISFQQIQKYEKGVNRLSAARLNDVAAYFGKPATWFSEGSTLKLANGASKRDLGAEILGTTMGRRLVEAFLDINVDDERAALLQLAEMLARRSARRLQAAE